MVKQKRRLRKGTALALSLLLLLGSLAGCGGKPQKDAAGGISGLTNTYMPPVNEDGYIVVTMPRTLLGGKTAETTITMNVRSRITFFSITLSLHLEVFLFSRRRISWWKSKIGKSARNCSACSWPDLTPA